MPYIVFGCYNAGVLKLGYPYPKGYAKDPVGVREPAADSILEIKGEI